MVGHVTKMGALADKDYLGKKQQNWEANIRYNTLTIPHKQMVDKGRSFNGGDERQQFFQLDLQLIPKPVDREEDLESSHSDPLHSRHKSRTGSGKQSAYFLLQLFCLMFASYIPLPFQHCLLHLLVLEIVLVPGLHEQLISLLILAAGLGQGQPQLQLHPTRCHRAPHAVL